VALCDGALPTSAPTVIAAPSPILAPVESARPAQEHSVLLRRHPHALPAVRNTWQRQEGTTSRHPNACKSELLLAEPLVCLPYGARHEHPPLGEELGVLEALEAEGSALSLQVLEYPSSPSRSLKAATYSEGAWSPISMFVL
jgi:hypothetical protein